MASDRRIDWPRVVGGAIGIGLAIFVILVSRGFPGASAGASGPAFFPQVVALVMGVASLFVVVTALRGTPRIPTAAASAEAPAADPAGPAHETGAAQGSQSTAVRLWLVVLASVLYPAAMTWLGYVISTLLYTWVLGLVMQPRRNWIMSALVAAILVASSYVAFAILLDATLPRGRLF